jgi:hypothetical protein
VFAISSPATISNNGATVNINALSGVDLWVADNDFVIIQHSLKFQEIEFLLDVVASGSGISPTFEYSTGTGPVVWQSFGPTDGTNGFQNTGIVAWLSSDTETGTPWDNADGSYQIRIIRTKNAVATVPNAINDGIKIAVTTEYGWDETAVITANTLILDDQINISNTFIGQIADNLVLSADTAGKYASIGNASYALRLNETVKNVTPTTTDLVDLGSASTKFKDIYCSGMTQEYIADGAVNQYSLVVVSGPTDYGCAEPLISFSSNTMILGVAKETVTTGNPVLIQTDGRFEAQLDANLSFIGAEINFSKVTQGRVAEAVDGYSIGVIVAGDTTANGIVICQFTQSPSPVILPSVVSPFFVVPTTTPAMVNGVELVIPMATETYDPDSTYSTSTNLYTAVADGITMITGGVKCSVAVAGQLEAHLYVNGTKTFTGNAAVGAAGTMVANVSASVYLVVGDTVQLRAAQFSGFAGAMIVSETFLSGHTMAITL